MRLLIDRNLERYAVTHTTRMMPQSVKWEPHQLQVAVATRGYDQPSEDALLLREQLPYLVSLCRSAKEGQVEFCISGELEMEAFRQLISKQGYLGIDWFADVRLTKVPCPVDRPSGVINPVVFFGKEGQIEFFESITHPRFLDLRKILGDAQLADAFHLWTAETAGLDAFVTMDKKFLNNVRHRSKQIGSSVSVMTPKRLCDEIGLPASDIERLAAEINPFA
jgi:hypothetical protein